MAKSKSEPKKMGAQAAGKSEADLAAKAKRIRESVTEQVLKGIGKPRDLHRVDVRLLQPGRARVNIYCHKPKEESQTCIVGGMVMTDSYYLWLSKEAKITKSSPALETKY